MGGAQRGAQFSIDPLRVFLNLSSFLSSQCCLRSARLSVFYILLHCLFHLFYHFFSSLVLPYRALCSLLFYLFIHGLKPICPWLFASSFAPSDHLLLFAWISLPLHHHQRPIGKWPLVLSQTKLQIFLKRFGISVTLWNDSSSRSAVKSDFKPYAL